MKTNLIYTIAADPDGATGHRQMAKLLASSLLRTKFSGEIIVFHNSRHPLFLVEREGLHERPVIIPLDATRREFVRQAKFFRYSIAPQIDPARYNKIMFVDCDVLALRNVDYMFEGSWDLAVYPQPGSQINHWCYGGYLTPKERRTLKTEGLNAGSWIIKAELYHEFTATCMSIFQRPVRQGHLHDQSTFNRAVLDYRNQIHRWTLKDMALPLGSRAALHYAKYSQSTMVHAASGWFVDDRLRFLFGLYAGTFLFDPELTLFNIMEM